MTETATVTPTQFYDWLTTMRHTEPVYCDERGIWHLFRHADVVRAIKDSETFSSDTNGTGPEQDPVIQALAEGNIVNMDPPRHRNKRGLIVKVFTPQLVDGLVPRIVEVATELLDDADANGRFDLVDTLAYPLPAIVIAQLLGVPTEDRPSFRRWAEMLLRSNENLGAAVVPDEREAAKQAEVLVPVLREITAYLGEHVAHHRAHSTDGDLIGLLIEARINGQGLSDQEIIGFSATLLLAGHITTSATVANVVHTLLAHPESLAEVRNDLRLVPNTIEEVLRYRPPFTVVGRVTTRDVEIGGQTIPAGKTVVPWLSSANRDPEKFPNPDRFDIHRNTNGLATFGHGIHFCVGARLARLEAQVTLELMLERYRDIAMDPEQPAVLYNPYLMAGLVRLPLVVTR